MAAPGFTVEGVAVEWEPEPAPEPQPAAHGGDGWAAGLAGADWPAAAERAAGAARRACAWALLGAPASRPPPAQKARRCRKACCRSCCGCCGVIALVLAKLLLWYAIWTPPTLPARWAADFHMVDGADIMPWPMEIARMSVDGKQRAAMKMFGRFPLAPTGMVGTPLEWVNISLWMDQAPSGPQVGMHINGDPLMVPVNNKYGQMLTNMDVIFVWLPLSSSGDDVTVRRVPPAPRVSVGPENWLRGWVGAQWRDGRTLQSWELSVVRSTFFCVFFAQRAKLSRRAV